MKNSKGSVWYGMHFYPGVAEYAEPGKEPFRVFLNESTIREMGPTFEGRPVFVMHVDEVDQDIDKLRNEADGWVVNSFYNEADGKHWVKFIICSEKGLKAIEQGYRLSNCYIPKTYGKGGIWNGVSYQKEIKGGEYEHLAIVPNPRYEESVILSPDEFKQYNESKKLELSKLTNHNGSGSMKFKLFKREKVENSADFENMAVVLPKSAREITITQLVSEADEREVEAGKPRLVNAIDLVEVDGEKLTIAEVLERLKNKSDEDDKHENEDEDDDDEVENEDDDEDAVENHDIDEHSDEVDDYYENEEDEAAAEAAAEEMKNRKKKNKKKNELEAKRRAKEKADRVRNARPIDNDFEAESYDPLGAVARGKARYGS